MASAANEDQQILILMAAFDELRASSKEPEKRGYCDNCNSIGGARLQDIDSKVRKFHVCSVCLGGKDEGAPKPIVTIEVEGVVYRATDFVEV
jgi:hypothetical protein